MGCAEKDTAAHLGYKLSVAPRNVPATSFLGSCESTDMGVVFVTDIYETQSFKTNETGVYPTSAAMLRDAAAIFSSSKS